MQHTARHILLSPLFLLGLCFLLLNDFVLKSQFHNFLTGKLSDFSGLFIFPVFFAVFFPKRKLLIYVLTIVLFVFWKSPFSQSLIDLWNSFQFFKIGRTNDYTDLLALSVLPLSYFHFEKETQNQKTLSLNLEKQILVNFVALISVFAFTATSLVEDRTVSIEGEYEFKLNKDEIEHILQQNEKIMSLKIERETDIFPANKYPDLKPDPNVFFAHFKLKQEICESKFPEFSFIIRQEQENTKIKAGSADFKCKEESMKPNTNSAIKQYEQELIVTFEREVIEKLRQNNSQ